MGDINIEGVESSVVMLAQQEADNFIKRKSERWLSIYKKDTNEVICNIVVELNRTRPLFQTPKEIIKGKEFVNITLNKSQYSSKYGFTTKIPVEYRNFLENNSSTHNWINSLTEDKAKELVTSIQNAYDEKMASTSATRNKDRYVELFTFLNPLTQSDYTLFLDREFGDLFMLCGIGLLLGSNQVINPDAVIELSGFRIGGLQDKDFNMPVYDFIATTPDSEFSLIDCLTDNSEYTITDDVYCKAVTFTRDLPANIKSGAYPVFYDKVQHINGSEIQLARQDTIPNLWVNLGVIKNLVTTAKRKTSKNRVPNYIIYNYSPNVYRVIKNGFFHKPETEFGFIVPIY